MIPARRLKLANGHTVEELLDRRPWLHLVESNVFDIPRRLREYDPGFFIVRNTLNGKFEVHHADNIGGTHCTTVQRPELDSRVIEDIRKSDVKMRGDKVVEEILTAKEKETMSREKETKTLASDMAHEIGPTLRKYIQGDY